MWLSRTWKLSVLPKIGKSLKQFAEDSRCEISSGKVHAGLSKLPFWKEKVWHFLSAWQIVWLYVYIIMPTSLCYSEIAHCNRIGMVSGSARAQLRSQSVTCLSTFNLNNLLSSSCQLANHMLCCIWSACFHCIPCIFFSCVRAASRAVEGVLLLQPLKLWLRKV